MKDKLLYSLTFLILLCFYSSGFSFDKPSELVNKFHETLKEGNISDKDKQEKKALLKQIVAKTFNYSKMIKFIYGRGWKNLNSELRTKLEETFLNFISFNYVQRFNGIEGLDFKYNETTKLEDRKIIVETLLITSDNEPIKINYLLEQTDMKWQIFDILLTGSISEIATKKSEFFNIIKNSGAEGLIDKINQTID